VVRQAERDGERADAIGAALQEGPVRLEQGVRPAVDASERHPDALAVGTEVARVLQRQRAGDGAETPRPVHAAGVALAEALARVLALRDGEGADAADPLEVHVRGAGARAPEGVPEGLGAGADRAHDPRSRDHDPSAHAGIFAERAGARPAADRDRPPAGRRAVADRRA
jgi:hypothetical protein